MCLLKCLLELLAGKHAQKFSFRGMLQNRGNVRRVCVNSVTWSLEKGKENNVENVMMSLVRPATEDYEDEAIKAVKGGSVIAVPTDTLYGFACDAWYVP